MRMEEEIILRENIKEFISSAELVYNKGDFTSSTILYFKTLFSVLDLIILKKTGRIPKDHSERFLFLKLHFLDLYNLLEKYYPVYRDTYTTKINKTVCGEIKKNVEKIIKEYKILENN